MFVIWHSENMLSGTSVFVSGIDCGKMKLARTEGKHNYHVTCMKLGNSLVLCVCILFGAW